MGKVSWASSNDNDYGIRYICIISFFQTEPGNSQVPLMVTGTVIKIDLGANQLDDECMKMLGEFIEYSETIEFLSIGKNKITDKGIEILSEYLIGNITLNTLDISRNKGITDKSLPYLIDIAKKTSIATMYVFDTLLSEENKAEINKLVRVPIDEREIPIKSSSKSAAKISKYE